MRNAASEAIQIAHVTDAHATVSGRPTTVLKHRSAEILEDVVEQIRQRAPDCVLFGGDNIDNRGSGELDLEAFADLTTDLRRWLCVPGNHEASVAKPGRITKAQFQRRFASNGIGPDAPGFVHTIGDVRVIGLDTTLVGAPGGLVPPDGLAFLRDALKAATERHILVLGHHLLVPCWAPYPFEKWTQDYLIQNAQEVLALLADHPRVRAYLCGHHHAHKITPVTQAGRFSFHQVMTGSPVAFPHAARVLTFEAEGLRIETLRPRDPSIVDEGRQAVLKGRKAVRFAELGASDQFLGYLEGSLTDNDVVLSYAASGRGRRAHRAAGRHG